MDNYLINWLKTEMKKWEDNNLITSETAKKIIDYYDNEKVRRQEEITRELNEKAAKNREAIKKLPKIFSAIAAVLIAAGIISLIAFNWNAIGREVKTAGAFVLAFLPPLFYVLLSKFSKNFTDAAKEFTALLWTLLFGGMIEFICQIYKIPASQEKILLFWLISSILIIYATGAKSIFYFSCILLGTTVITAQNIYNSNAIFFYPAIAALIPFARKNKIDCYILTGLGALLLGFALEKCLPGLWIMCYLSAASICLWIGLSKKDQVLTWLSIAGMIALAVLMVIPNYWKNIGVSFFRSDSAHNQMAAICDYICCAGLLIFALALPVMDYIKNRKLALQHSIIIAPIAATVFYFICSANPAAHEYSTLFVFGLTVLYTILGAFFYKQEYFYFIFIPLISLGCTACTTLSSILIYAAVLLMYGFSRIRMQRFNEEGIWQKALCASLISVTSIFAIITGSDITWYASDAFLASLESAEVLPKLQFSWWICAAVFALALAVNLISLIKEKGRHIREALELFVPAVTFSGMVLYSYTHFIDTDFTTIIQCLILILFATYAHIVQKKLNVKYLTGFLAVGFFASAIIIMEYYWYSFAAMFGWLSMLSLYFYNNSQLKLLTQSKPEVNEVSPSELIQNIFLIFFMLLTLSAGSQPRDFATFGRSNSGLQTVIFVISLLFMFGISIAEPMIGFKKIKKLPQVGMNLVGVIYTISFISMIPILMTAEGKGPAKAIYIITSILILLAVFAFALQMIIIAFKEQSAKKMNLFSIYFIAVILIKFLQQPLSLIARGILFISCGLVILILNLIFANRIKNAKEWGDFNENKK